MLLQRFTEVRIRNAFLVLACSFVLGACASGPKPADSARAAEAGQPGAIREVPAKAQTLYEQAVSSMASGDFLDAQLRFQEFLLQYPNFPGAHVNLAIIYTSNGDDKAVENSLTDALILDPEHPAALNQLGMLLRRQGQFEAAESAYMKAVTAHPDYALAHYNLGVLNELYLQRLDIALQHFERYQELGGEDEQVTKWIADLKRRIGSSQRTANVTE
ncbi:MAG: tetratricopeptide repeat protein [Gammaproteobacteria bacterium]|nr:tetratricopeptide repeat protein [Gammaproteobacteria bacterium]MDH4314666.1 tetratricopeptide repeat protein [Gammaproteobacteria bacterium]MDH5213387.1 tetratricopeptide repeat protein [Gammaproteobacteria bacterium]MDH5501962.1 tetratricopeptide repeat protein [Gammaproteobacteria bacterium]